MTATIVNRSGNTLRISGTATEADGTAIAIPAGSILAVLRRKGQTEAAAALVKTVVAEGDPGEWHVDLTAAEARTIGPGIWPVALILDPDGANRRQLPEAERLPTLMLRPESLSPTPNP